MSWIFISIMAAAFQTLRFMLQKHLRGVSLSTGGATFARFAYGAPITLVLAAGYLAYRDVVIPDLSGMFWVYAVCGGFAQIVGTACIVALFSQRNFAVGITFKKTEVVQTAIIGAIILGDQVSAPGMVAIVVGLVGVLILSDPMGGTGKTIGTWRTRVFNRAAGIGILSGALFAISAVSYRGGVLEIGGDDAVLRALIMLACATTLQAIAMGAWLAWREAGELTRVFAARRTAVWMGMTGMAGSLCWFTAFGLQNAAYVFAVGQVEVIFSLLASVLFFGEKISARELRAIALVTVSILALVLFH